MKTPSLLTFSYFNETFRQQVDLFVGDKQLVEAHNHAKGLYVEIPPCFGHTVMEDGFDIFIFLKKFDINNINDICTLAHECCHAADFILARIGQKTSDSSRYTDETRGYTMESMLSQFLIQLNDSAKTWDSNNISIYHPL